MQVLYFFLALSSLDDRLKRQNPLLSYIRERERERKNTVNVQCSVQYTLLLLHLMLVMSYYGPPLWSSGQSFWLQIQRSRVRFPALPDFLSSSGSGTGSTQPREVN